jgi:glutaredoxin 3
MSLVLYVKTWCPWCTLAIEALDSLKLPYTVCDIEKDHSGAARMRALSGQTRVPTLEAGAFCLADFGPEELVPFLRKNGILPPPALP